VLALTSVTIQLRERTLTIWPCSGCGKVVLVVMRWGPYADILMFTPHRSVQHTRAGWPVHRSKMLIAFSWCNYPVVYVRAMTWHNPPGDTGARSASGLAFASADGAFRSRPGAHNEVSTLGSSVAPGRPKGTPSAGRRPDNKTTTVDFRGAAMAVRQEPLRQQRELLRPAGHQAVARGEGETVEPHVYLPRRHVRASALAPSRGNSSVTGA
jgi:hypothetical protein